MDEYITISSKRYSKLFRERQEFLKQKWFYIIFSFALFVFLIGVFFAFLGTVSDILKEKEQALNDYKYQLMLNEQYKTLLVDTQENENEIAQLRDRILFLSFAQAMYEEEKEEQKEVEPIEGDDITEVDKTTFYNFDWTEYVNLFSIGQKVPLPTNIDTNTFRCMDYRTITDKTSWQYKIQEQSITEIGTGLRFYQYKGEKYYTVALATAYGIDLGNAYEVELENGTIFKIIHAEYKHDIRYPSPTDFGDKDKNYDGEETCSVIEFVYDWYNAPEGLISDGEANRWLGEGCDIYGNGCNIVRMTYLGKIWKVS